MLLLASVRGKDPVVMMAEGGSNRSCGYMMAEGESNRSCGYDGRGRE